MQNTYLTGELRLDEVEYRIIGGALARPWWKFWAPREEWFVESDFVKMGPFDTLAKAMMWRDRASRMDAVLAPFRHGNGDGSTAFAGDYF